MLVKWNVKKVHIFRFSRWHSGFNYFVGEIQNKKVFIKVCVGKYNTIPAESYLCNFTEWDAIPKVIGSENGQLQYIITEFIDYVKIDSIKETSEIVHIISQAREILLYMQNKGIYHRDIRPENLMIRTVDHKLVLFDFGWAVYRGKNLMPSAYSFIEQILNIEYRQNDYSFDDAYSMYVSLLKIFGNEYDNYLTLIKERIDKNKLVRSKDGSLKLY